MRERCSRRELLLVSAGIVIVFLRLYDNRHGVSRSSSHVYEWTAAACALRYLAVLSECHAPCIRSILDYGTIAELDRKLKLVVAGAWYVDRLHGHA